MEESCVAASYAPAEPFLTAFAVAAPVRIVSMVCNYASPVPKVNSKPALEKSWMLDSVNPSAPKRGSPEAQSGIRGSLTKHLEELAGVPAKAKVEFSGMGPGG